MKHYNIQTLIKRKYEIKINIIKFSYFKICHKCNKLYKNREKRKRSYEESKILYKMSEYNKEFLIFQNIPT